MLRKLSVFAFSALFSVSLLFAPLVTPVVAANAVHPAHHADHPYHHADDPHHHH